MTHEVLTPTVRGAWKSSAFWIGAGAFGLLVVIILIVLSGGAGTGGPRFSASNPAPHGSMALAEVLQQQGIEVTETTTLVETLALAEDLERPTVFVANGAGILDGAQLADLSDRAGHLVLLSPDFTQLDTFAPDIAQAGSVEGVVAADCSVRPVERAEEVTGDGIGFRLLDDDATLDNVIVCLDSGDDVHSLVQYTDDTTTVTILGTENALTNEHIASRGNAALALGLLGGSDHLIWYLPSAVDMSEAAAPTIGELTPDWVPTVLVLLILVGVAAGFWRGRRLGPIVIENLPVTVRASETMEGRARLYERSGARDHALETLRHGSARRIAAAAGLGKAATRDDVAATASSLTGADLAHVRWALVDAHAHSDGDLQKISDQLVSLENAVHTAIAGDRPHQPKNPGE